MKHDWQGKRNDQIETSYKLAFWAIVVIIALVFFGSLFGCRSSSPTYAHSAQIKQFYGSEKCGKEVPARLWIHSGIGMKKTKNKK